jgi:PAS domain S-box-containing protein
MTALPRCFRVPVAREDYRHTTGGPWVFIGATNAVAPTWPDLPRGLAVQILDEAADGVLVSDQRQMGSPIVYANAAFTRITGYSLSETLGRNCRFLQSRDQEQPEIAIVRKAIAAGRPVTVTLRNYRRDGSMFWNEIRLAPLRAVEQPGAPVTHYVGFQRDVTAHHQLEKAVRERDAQQGVLIAELQHRTRNLIAVVRSLAGQTLRDSASFDGFDARLRALSRAQGLLARLAEVDRVDFDELLRTELAAHGRLDELGKVSLEGPAGVRLRSGPVQIFALALHELATNAMKYGALSQPAGRLAVRWNIISGHDGAEPSLYVEWHESGVAMPDMSSPHPSSGYGRELIERALPYQLRAKTTYELTRDGVHCTILAPVVSVPGS